MILDIMTHIVHGIEANILVEEAGHSLQGSEDVCKISMDGEASSIPQGVSYLLGYMVEGIGRIVDKTRAEGLKKLLLNIHFEFSKENVAVSVILDSHVEGRIN